MHPIVERLKRRKLVQWALAYLAGGVALYQVLDSFGDPWGIGDGFLRVAQVAFVVGFFVILTLAWYHGERGNQRVSGPELVIIACLLGIGALGMRLVGFGPESDAVRPTDTMGSQVVVSRLEGLAPNHLTSGDFELGPIGSGYYYTVGRAGTQKWHSTWASPQSHPVEGSGGGANQISPDGLLMSEVFQGELRVIPLAGGAIRRRALPYHPAPAVWGGDGFLYFTGADSTIHRVSQDLEGPVERMGIEREEDDGFHHSFRLLPGGDWGVFAVVANPSRIEAYEVSTGDRHVLTEGVSPRPTSTGHLVFGSSDGQIMAATINRENASLGPAVVMVRNGVLVAGAPVPVLNWSLASDGTLAYWDASAKGEFVWVARDGTATAANAEFSFGFGGAGQGWSLSPDDREIAFTGTVNAVNGVWVHDLDDQTTRTIASGVGMSFRVPRWLGGDSVLFVSDLASLDGRQAAHITDAKGLSRPQVRFRHETSLEQAFPIRDGQSLILHTIRPNRELLILRNGESMARPIFDAPDLDIQGAALSPDGRWLAYTSGESGRLEVYVSPFPDVGAARTSVSVDGGIAPLWSDSGRELFYVRPDRTVLAAKVADGVEFDVLEREQLFNIGPEFAVGANTQFADIAADGRFLMIRLANDPRVVLYQGFFDDLKRLVPH